MIDENSPMSDIVAGLKCADFAACYAFCRRQDPVLLEALDNGAARLWDIEFEFEFECRQPDAHCSTGSFPTPTRRSKPCQTPWTRPVKAAKVRSTLC